MRARGSVLVGLARARHPAFAHAGHARGRGRALGLPYVYRLLDADIDGRNGSAPLPTLIAVAECFGFTGFNVTFPYKQEIIPLLDEFRRRARDARLGQHGRARNGPAHRPQHRHVGLSRRASARGMARRRARAGAAAGSGRRRCSGRARAARLRRRDAARIADVDADRGPSSSRRGSRIGSARGRSRSCRPGGGAAACRRHRQRDTRRHGEAAGDADRRRPAAAANAGSPTSSTSRWRPNCSARRSGAAAARSTATAWPYSRRCGPSSCSPASGRTSIG